MRIEKVDKRMFAIHRVIYDNLDSNLWFDWDKRVAETDFVDTCFFVMEGDERVGGFSYHGGAVRHPFLVPPFEDRMSFWSFLLQSLDRPEIRGVADADRDVLAALGYAVTSARRVMIRPTEILQLPADERFYLRMVDPLSDRETIASVMSADQDGVPDGSDTPNAQLEAIDYLFGAYDRANFSRVLLDRDTNGIVGICLAGMYGDVAEIGEISVLPAYRRRGLARRLITAVLSDVYAFAPFLKLCVTSGNPAEAVYRRLGFCGGPQFSFMLPKRPD